MEWMKDVFAEVIWSLAGLVITLCAAGLGRWAKGIKAKWMENETANLIARQCVRAVEMMDRHKTGEEKLSHATSLAKGLLEEAGVRVSEERLRVLLESALAEWKGAFEGV
ncbi:MAG: hypothetical protein IKC69_05690 [Clostridia bacterium]|nr:hypothetical protein [Clostridia bacterium]